MPLQSSSMPLHTSVLGPVRPFAPHCIVPFLQMPVPQATPGGQHVAPRPGTSSFLPLQSSSRPLHVSTVGFVAPLHTSSPFEPQASLPPEQIPTPHLPLGQHESPTVPPGRLSI